MTIKVHPQSIEEALQKAIKLCLVEENFLTEFKSSSDKLNEDLNNLRQLIDTSELGEGQDPNDENAQLNIPITQGSKSKVLGFMDDISMMFQLLTPKYLEVNQKLQHKEKEIFESIKTRFNEELKNYGEKLEGDKLVDFKKDTENLKAKLVATEAELNELRVQFDEKVKTAQSQGNGSNEITEKLLNETIEQYNKEIRELQKKLQDAMGAISTADKKMKDLEFKNKELQAQSEKNFQEYQKIYQEYSQVVTANESSSTQAQSEANTLRSKILALEKEKEALTKRAHDMEQSKNEFENKMIQEKLKHHHTQGDLQKVKENLEESQKSLSEEIEGRKQEIAKTEELKRRLNDYDKKLKDHKRTIKKLSQKILELQESSDSKREDVIRESQSKEDIEENLTEPGSLNKNTLNFQGSTQSHSINQTHLLSTLHERIKALEDQVRETSKLNEVLTKENTDFQRSNKELAEQVSFLHERREKGLQEIQKLNKLLEGHKNGGQDDKSHHKLNGNANQIFQEVFKHFQPVKKAIDQLYKEIVITISNQKIMEISEDNKKVLKDIMPGFAETLIKIEKKINDVNLVVLEFSDYLE